MNKLLNCFIVLGLILSPCYAQDLSDLVLRRGIGIRALGMGGAHTAIVNDASAVFFNPAGLAEPGFAYTFGNLDTEEKIASRSFELLKLGYVGYGSWRAKITNDDEINTTGIGFGNRSGFISWGINSKALDWTVSGSKKEGWSGDIGFLFRITPYLKLGVVGQDVLASKDFIMPAGWRLGLGITPFKGLFTIALDLELNNKSESFGHFGIESSIVKGLSIRGGLDRGEPTAGLTLDLGIFSFDYAALFSKNNQTIQRYEMGLKILPGKERPFSIIKPKEYALIDVRGSIVGGRSEYSLLGGYFIGLDSILTEIRKASKDSSIDGIMLRIGSFGGGLDGLAIAQEIRIELLRAKAKGKKIVAYIEEGALGDGYYMASCADLIVAAPGAAVGGLGKSIEVYRLKGLLQKLGIEYQIFAKGKYKSALDPFNPKFSAEQEEMIKGLIADLYRQMLNDISSDRNISLDKIKEIGDGLIYSAREAKQLGLIDKVGYYKDSKKFAAEILGEEKEEAKIVEPEKVEPEEVFFTRFFGVAVIEIDGEIVSGKGGENLLFGGQYVGSESVAEYIRRASDDVFVKAIIIRINSPGGSAVASGEIYKAIQYAKDKRKVIVASMGTIAASGGYYIASAADKIVADPSTITGSIGVIGYVPVFEDLLKKLDVKTEVIKEGEHSDMFSGLRKMTSVEVANMSRLLEEEYNEFINAVVAGRKLTTAEVEAAAQGKIYTGSQALDFKLVDKLGGFCDAIDLAKEEADILGEPRLIFYHEPGFFTPLAEGAMESLGLKKFFNFPPNSPALLKYN